MSKSIHKYANLNEEELKEHQSNFLINSWSYSKQESFSRNEKAFEMSYIYNSYSKRSASSIAGNAYHSALDFYFTQLMEDGVVEDLVRLETVAITYIDEVHSNSWKLQKTTPTIELCKIKATKLSFALLGNFMREVSVYDFRRIIAVELYCDEFVTINGVDIPLPCHARIDLMAETHDGKIVIVDHKSKAKFSDDQSLKFSIGKQAITYLKCVEKKLNLKVNEVWFIENKYSQNRDKSPQLNCFKVSIDNDVLKLYEALLYEPLKRMIEAVSDPDHVYIINEADNFVDKAEIHNFWTMTMIAEIEDFNVPEDKKEMISKRLKKTRDATLASVNPLVIKNFRKEASEFIKYDLTNKDMTKEQKIEHRLRSLGMIVKVAHTFEGYSSNTYLVEISAGTTISSIMKYRLDIASALNVPSVRIKKELFIHENESFVAIECSMQSSKNLMFSSELSNGLKIPLGRDNFNNIVHWDMESHSTPHMLICGATGSGKSVCIISIIEYAKLADVKDIIIFDPKYEFGSYRSKNIEVHNDIEELEEQMEKLVEKMNKLVKSGKKQTTLVIFDEFADAVAQSKKGKELEVKEMVEVGHYKQSKAEIEAFLPPQPKMALKVTSTKKSLEQNLKILLQKGRSSGFRIISATQRASVKVITGDAKVNYGIQICFRVPKELDSVVVLGQAGAESLSGKGDGLINSPEYNDLVRFQGFYKK